MKGVWPRSGSLATAKGECALKDFSGGVGGFGVGFREVFDEVGRAVMGILENRAGSLPLGLRGGIRGL